MTLIDLTQPIRSGMPVYPGDPEVRFSSALTIDRDGSAVTAVALGSHTGTHLDAPAHLIARGRTVDEILPGELVGDALVCDVSAACAAMPGAGSGGRIDATALGLDACTSVPRIVAIHTGWDRWFGVPGAPPHPVLCPEAVRQLVKLGMRVLCVDTPSPDAAEAGAALPVHAIVLGADGCIVENIRGLAGIGRHARLGIFPLPLAGADGAPCRVVAWQSAQQEATLYGCP